MILLCCWTVAGGVVGVVLSKTYKNRKEIACELFDLVCEIERNIAVYKKPIKDVLGEYKYKTALEKLVQKEDISEELLKKEEAVNFLVFISEMEVSQSENASVKLAIYKDEVSKIMEKAKEDNQKKGITYQKLGLLFGLAVGILVC